MSLESERGIFLVNKLRKILMSLIYNSKVQDIEKNLTDSNIGARKKKAPREHFFVLNAVINERIQRKNSASIDIVFYDVRQAFDSLWTERTFLDLFANGVKDDMLNLLHEGSKAVEVRVKTPVGETNVREINDIILQGEMPSSRDR